MAASRWPVGKRRALLRVREPVALQPAIERAPAEAELARRACLVAAGFGNHLHDVLPLERRERLIRLIRALVSEARRMS